MRVLVTGAAGFIGSHLCEALIEDGIYVTAVDRVPVVDAINLQACQKNSLFEYIQLDISILDALEPVFAGVDAVFHLAALADIVPSIETPETYFDSNVVGTFNVAETCRRTRVHRLVYAASASCYGIPQQVPTPEEAAINPQYPYALTKYLACVCLMYSALDLAQTALMGQCSEYFLLRNLLVNLSQLLEMAYKQETSPMCQMSYRLSKNLC
jgi:UDP-glucose 4-epimerase